MKKLFTMKEWLSLPDTAAHLSALCNEDVSAADVLRLGLDGRLQLSMDFVNGTRVRKGKVVRYTPEEINNAIETGNYPDDLKWSDIGAQVQAMKTGIPCGDNPPLMVVSLRLSEDLYLTLEDKISTIFGVWDIPMLGGDRLDIEHAYQMLTMGPEITLSNLEGAFVGSVDEGVICQIQESTDENEYVDGSKAQLQAIEEKIKDENIDAEFAERLRKQHAEMRKVYLSKKDAKNPVNDYYPAAGLPDDAVLVVRNKALVNFEKILLEPSEPSQRELTTTERNTLLKMVIGMAMRGYKYDPKATKGSAVRDIVTDLAAQGLSVTDDTVRKYLREATQNVLPNS